MNDELQSLLADYAAPVEDDGFSDAVLARLPQRAEFGAARPRLPWRDVLVAACLGGTGWAAALRLAERVEFAAPDMAIPDMAIPDMAIPDMTLDPASLAGAALCGVLLCGWLGLQWLDG